nr:MAG: DNA pilot protein [Microvirus sp.]
MGFFSSLISPITGLIGGILGSEGAEDRNQQSIEFGREQMAFQERMSNTAHQREIEDLAKSGINPILSGRAGASAPSGVSVPNLENVAAAGVNSAMQAQLVRAQIDQAESVTEANQAQAMKSRAEAWQISNYAGPLAQAQTSSAQSSVNLQEFQTKQISHAIDFIKQQILTEYTKRDLNMSTADLNRAMEVLKGLEAKHSSLGLNRSRAESKFYEEGAIGEISPEIRMIMDVVKGVMSMRK